MMNIDKSTEVLGKVILVTIVTTVGFVKVTEYAIKTKIENIKLQKELDILNDPDSWREIK